MRAPSDAQAALLALVTEHEAKGANVEWGVNDDRDGYRPSIARLYVERVDREKNTARLDREKNTARLDIALGLWRERKLNAPAAPLPTLAGADREVMELADRARRLGYKIAPMTNDARLQARRLARAGWARRGFIGGSVSSVDPTPMAVVEVNPEAADAA